MESENPNRQNKVSQASSFTTRHAELFCITPLSKYLAMFLMLVLPFVGGYVGYIYAPEKVVEVEKQAYVDQIQLDTDRTEIEFVWGVEKEIFDLNSKYHQSLSELSDFKNANLTKRLWGRKLGEKLTLLTACFDCSHAPNAYYIYDEVNEKIVKQMDYFTGVPHEAAKKWVLRRHVESGELVNLLIAVDTSEVSVIDFVNDNQESLYIESESGISLCEDEGMLCEAEYAVTDEGNIILGRYKLNRETVENFKLLETLVITLPKVFESPYTD